MREGRDIDGLIGALQSIYPLVATVAILPWIMLPVVKSSLYGRFLIPSGLIRVKAVSANESQLPSILCHFSKANFVFQHYDDMLVKHSGSPHMKQRQRFIDGLVDSLRSQSLHKSRAPCTNLINLDYKRLTIMH